jgi:hypothetical protein
MQFYYKHCLPLFLLFLHLLCYISIVQALNKNVPAILVFGDSTVDPGNNNHISTVFKCNFPPYGREFVNHTPTGRFTDGRLSTDFVGKLIYFYFYFFFK